MLPVWLECRLGICTPARSSGVPHTSSEAWVLIPSRTASRPRTLRSRRHCDTCPTRAPAVVDPSCDRGSNPATTLSLDALVTSVPWSSHRSTRFPVRQRGSRLQSSVKQQSRLRCHVVSACKRACHAHTCLRSERGAAGSYDTCPHCAL